MPTTLFSTATAKIMAARSAEARRAASHQLKALRQFALHHAATKPPAQPPAEPQDHAQLRLARVRRQIDLLDKRIESLIEDADEGAAQAIDRLVSAQARLAEQERVLSGRPLPGSLRPRAAGARSRPGAVGPAAEEGVGPEAGMPGAS